MTHLSEIFCVPFVPPGNPASDRHKPHSEAEMAKLDRRRAGELFLTDEMYAALSPEQRTQCHEEIMQFYFGDRGLCKETLPQFVDVRDAHAHAIGDHHQHMLRSSRLGSNALLRPVRC